MQPLVVQYLLDMHASMGDGLFVALMLLFALILSVKWIPAATDMMVNAAAGLAGKYLGRQYRTLVINCSTNNPEIATMLVAFLTAGALGIGGIGTPLGSNFANIYLIFLVAPGFVLIREWFSDRPTFFKLLDLLKREKKIVVWHLTMSAGMFVVACLAFRSLTGQFPIGFEIPDVVEAPIGIESEQAETAVPTKLKIALAGAVCLTGVGLFLVRDRKFRMARPSLFEDIDDDDHVASWKVFAIGTFGLVVGCYVINMMFVVVTELYESALARVMGPAVFAVLHFFLGALVTSLPEMTVAVHNLSRVRAPDLNTALSSASASNMSNLAIAALGCLVALFFPFG